jgi:hypothetical protein
MSAAPTTPPDATRQTNFANMSVALTGFISDVVNPLFDPLGLVALYLQTADSNASPTDVDSLIQQYLTLGGTGLTNQQIADKLVDTNNPSPGAQAALARAIVTMWYLGSWYSSPTASPVVASQNAYIGGLAWKAMQAHPMGASDFTFGYWVQPPPSLSDFGVDLPAGGEKNA